MVLIVRLICMCVLLMTVALGFGCSDVSDRQQSESKISTEGKKIMPPATPEYGGRLVLASIGDFVSCIPILATDSSSHELAQLLYVSPLRYDKDLNIVPYAAEKYEVEDDGKLIRITMRKGIQWEDGVELTADDVEFTYRMTINPKTPTAYAEDYLAVKSFTKLNKYTFEVRYDEPYARALTSWMMDIMPKHKLEGEDLTNTEFARKPLAAGPFRLKEWKAGTKLVLSANETFFQGRPYLDEIVYRIIPDLSTMFLELKAGKIDMMGLTPQQYLFQTKGEQWEREYTKYKYLSFGYEYLGYNLENPLFTDGRVRKALSHAIDKKSVIKGALMGLGEPTIGPYKPGTWVYNTTIEDYPYSPESAQKMLAEAGWGDSDGDGILDKDGKPLAFTILTNQGNDLRIKIATIIQSQLKAVGVAVKIRTVEWAAFLKEFIFKGRFDAVVLGWNILQDPDSFKVWHSSHAKDGGLNFTRFRNGEVDTLLEKGRRALEQNVRKAAYFRFQEILHAEQPYDFLCVPYSLPIVHSRFHGIEPAPAGLTHNIERWWVPSTQRKYKGKQ